MEITIYRQHERIKVLLMKNKDDGTFSFVNLNKCHICPCRFKTRTDAILDIFNYEENIFFEFNGATYSRGENFNLKN